MYTQCPECGTAFRVTAEVLKVAAGKVRCGGCAIAFNALDYLSEEKPEQKSAAPEAKAQLPELQPEPIEKEDGLPESISAEQSAALLKTLDQLAGSDIRIEDTGVEWMVLDDDPPPAPLDIETPDTNETEAADFDEILEDSPTPIDEFLTNTPEVVDSPEIFEESANAPAQTPVEELRFDDNTPLPEDFGFGDEMAATAYTAAPEPEPEPAQPQPDITLSDPHEWTDILDEFEELAGDVARPLDAELEALLDEDEEAEAEESVAEEDEELAFDEPDDEITAIEDLDVETDDDEIIEVEEDADDETELEFEFEDEDEDELEGQLDDEEIDDEESDEEELDDDDIDVIDEDPQLDLIDEPEVEAHNIEAELELREDEDEDEDENEDLVLTEDEDSGEHFIPPMSEEEQTVNMQIDQELLAIAIEDDDGFASTIVIPEDHTEAKAIQSKGDDDLDDDTDLLGDPNDESDSPGVGFETIIMEGADIKSAIDVEKRAADVAEAAELQEIAKAAEAEAARKSGSNRYAMIAGAVVLALLLIVQVVHHSREALATNPVFNNTFGPIYRALGKPLQPSWDITGWQFEVTRGSAEIEAEDNSTETSEILTVYSRIGNNSENPLPYPLIRISLTDRFQEPLGSHVLEPGDYLGDNMDPRRLVEPGESFEAAINVASRSEDATGFRLDVCYRHTDHQLRCKDTNFK